MDNLLFFGGCLLISAGFVTITTALTQAVFRSRDRRLMAIGKDPDDVYLADHRLLPGEAEAQV